jgi:hypothetical protein
MMPSTHLERRVSTLQTSGEHVRFDHEGNILEEPKHPALD